MLTGIRDAVLIHNPAAGRPRERLRHLDAACRVLAESGIAVELAETSTPEQATEISRRAVRDRRGMVIACGGDGTINEIANGLAASDVPLAILPAGTANVLGKELGLPWNIPAAARRIPTGRLERIALGLAQRDPPAGPSRYFVCIGGAGVDGSMVYRTSARLKRATGTFAYWVEGFRHFFTYPLIPFAVVADGQSFNASQVIVGRTKNFGGPFKITAQADLFEDWFEVAVFTTTSRFRYPSHVVATWLAKLQRQGDIHFVRARRVLCHAVSEAAIYVEMDGEPAGTLPVEFRIVPDALTLVVPGDETKPASSRVL